MSNSRLQCINVPSVTYSGREQSPLHFGLSAEGYDLNTQLEGYDKLIWIVQNKNNRKVWIRRPENFINNEKEKDDIIIEELVTTTKVNNKQIDKKPLDGIKKITDYNMFLTFRLNKLKEDHKDDVEKKNNKELFNIVVAEWKNIKNNASELVKTIEEAKEWCAKNNTKK